MKSTRATPTMRHYILSSLAEHGLSYMHTAEQMALAQEKKTWNPVQQRENIVLTIIKRE